MKPYYQDRYCTIYRGDCREILPGLSSEPESIITDPIWPNSVFDGIDPHHLLSTALRSAPAVDRVVIHLGCDSDPRFLSAVSERWPFLRVCWLEYARPHYKGRLLYGSDIAYVFGIPPESAPGRHVMPGRCMAQRTGIDIQKEICTNGDGNDRAHPCPRRIQHVAWLVDKFGGDSVLDPFLGSGTTAVACKAQEKQCIGIEIEERYCEIAANRLRQEMLELV